MISIRIEGLKELQQRFAYAAEQLPFATSVACNNLAFAVREAEMETIARVFDRPKPQTVRNIRVFKGTKQRPGATIAFQQIYSGDEYMIPEVDGGQRTMKPSEKRLGRYYVPGAGAKMDKYGNMQGGQTTQVLSRLKRFPEVGYLMNETAKSKGRRRGASKSTEYFMVTKKTGGLAPGVYQRIQSAAGFGGKTSKSLQAGSFQKGATRGKFASVIRGRGVKPIMIFTKGPPSYRPRFPFYQVGQKVVANNFERMMKEAMDYAMRTKR